MEKQNSPPRQRRAEAGHVPRRHFRLQGMRRHGGCVLNVVAFFLIRVLLLPGCASLTPDFTSRSDRRICQDFQRLQMAPSSVHLSSGLRVTITSAVQTSKVRSNDLEFPTATASLPASAYSMCLPSNCWILCSRAVKRAAGGPSHERPEGRHAGPDVARQMSGRRADTNVLPGERGEQSGRALPA